MTILPIVVIKGYAVFTVRKGLNFYIRMMEVHVTIRV